MDVTGPGEDIPGEGRDEVAKQPSTTNPRYAADAPADEETASDESEEPGEPFCSHCGEGDHTTDSCPEILSNNHSQSLAATAM